MTAAKKQGEARLPYYGFLSGWPPRWSNVKHDKITSFDDLLNKLLP